MKKKVFFLASAILLLLIFSHQPVYSKATSIQELTNQLAESLKNNDSFEKAKHLFISLEDANEIEKRIKSIPGISENYPKYYDEKNGTGAYTRNRFQKGAAKDMILNIVDYHAMTISKSQNRLLFYYFPEDVERKTVVHQELNLFGDPKLGHYRTDPPKFEIIWKDLISKYRMYTENELIEVKESKILKSEPLTVETRGFADKTRNYNGQKFYKINGVEAFLASVKFNMYPTYGLRLTFIGLKIDNNYILCDVPAIEKWGKK